MKPLEKFLQGKNKNIIVILLLCGIFLLALFLRNIALPNQLLFGYEQGRDALVAHDIITHTKFTLLGPQTDIQGIYHGVGYYYWLAFIYFLTKGDPAQAILIFAFMNALTSIIVYFIAKDVIGKERYALLASFMTAISFDIIVYGQWLSNVSLSIPLLAIFFFFFVRLVKTKNINYWIPVGLFGGILSQFEILHLLYALFVIIVSIRLFRLPIKNKQFIIGFVLLLLDNITFLLFDLRHDFLVTKGLLSYVTSQALSVDPLYVAYIYIDGFIKTLILGVYPSNGMLLFLFAIIIGYIFYKTRVGKRTDMEKLLFLLLFFTFPYIFLLRYDPLEHYFAGTTIIAIIGLNYVFSRIEKVVPLYAIVIIYCVIAFSSISFVQRSLNAGTNIFYHGVQQGYIYKDQLLTLDYMFTHAPQGFDYDTFTIPYYEPQAWQYLYMWYGQKQYPGVYVENQQSTTKDIVYLVIEPATQGKYLNSWLQGYDKKTTLLKTVTIGTIQLQVRQKKQPMLAMGK